MALIHPLSKECVSTQLSLWSVPPTQLSIEESKYAEYYPIASISASSPLEFTIPGSDRYLDLSDTLLVATCRIVNEDGTQIAQPAGAAGGVVAPAKYWIASLFSSVGVYFNNVLVSGGNTDYPYISYMETLLSHNKASKSTHLEAGLWIDGDETVVNLARRSRYVQRSKYVEMIGKIHADVFRSCKLLLNHVNVKITLTRSKDIFAIESSVADQAPLKIEIKSAKLLVKRVKVAASILNAHSLALQSGSARYTFDRVITKVKTIPAGVLSHHVDNLFNGNLPERIVVGLVEHAAQIGNIAMDPFNFRHFDLSYIALTVNGDTISSLQMDFGNDLYAEAYHSLNRALGISGSNNDNGITMRAFANGSALFAWDLTADWSAGDHSSANLVKGGSVRMEFRFANALPTNVSIIVYAEFPTVLEVDASRDIILTY